MNLAHTDNFFYLQWGLFTVWVPGRNLISLALSLIGVPAPDQRPVGAVVHDLRDGAGEGQARLPAAQGVAPVPPRTGGGKIDSEHFHIWVHIFFSHRILRIVGTRPVCVPGDVLVCRFSRMGAEFNTPHFLRNNLIRLFFFPHPQ